MNIEINYLAVLLAGVASMALGFIWYGPLLGKQWMKEKGLSAEHTKKDRSKMTKYYGVMMVLALVSAYVLAHMILLAESFFMMSFMTTALITSFWMWLGFILPVQASQTIFGSQNWRLFGIDATYQLVSVLIMGLVMALIW